MASHDDGESFFDDDDLDALPNDALIELENDAIQFTQAQTNYTSRVRAAPSSDYGDDFEDEDLDDAVVIDESRSTPAIIPTFRRTAPGQATQHEQFRQQRHGTVNNSNLANRQRYNTPPKFNETNRLPPTAPINYEEPKVEQGGDGQAHGPDVSSLQRQIEEVMFSEIYQLPFLIVCSCLKSEMPLKKISMPRLERLQLFGASRRRR
jgi:hypothetical protein